MFADIILMGKYEHTNKSVYSSQQKTYLVCEVVYCCTVIGNKINIENRPGCYQAKIKKQIF